MTDPILAGLMKRRADLVHELQTLHERTLQAHGDLAHLDATIRQFDARYKPKRSTSIPRGQLTKIALTALRVARKPLSLREIAAQLLIATGGDGSDPVQTARMVEKARRIMGRQQAQRIVTAEADAQGRQFWRIYN